MPDAWIDSISEPRPEPLAEPRDASNVIAVSATDARPPRGPAGGRLACRNGDPCNGDPCNGDPCNGATRGGNTFIRMDDPSGSD